MIPIVATTAGLVFGVVYFGVLWFSVRRATRGAWGLGWMTCGSAIRMGTAGVVFYGFSRFGAGATLAALVGFFLARSMMSVRVARVGHSVNVRTAEHAN